MRDHSSSADRSATGAALGTLLAVLVAGFCGASRDLVGQTSAALALALVVVVAATIGGRGAGLTTAVVATMGFNFFMIPPYGTLRVHTAQDAGAIAMLGLTAVVVGTGTQRRGRTRARLADDIDTISALNVMAAHVADGVHPDVAWMDLQRSLAMVVAATDVSFVDAPVPDDVADLPVLDERGNTERRPVLLRRSTVTYLRYTPRGLSFPRGGVAVVVRVAGTEVGRVVMHADPATGSDHEHRAAAVALVRLWAVTRWPGRGFQPAGPAPSVSR